MTVDQHAAAIASLPIEEQLAVVREVWDRLPHCTTETDASAIKAELDRRMDRYRADPDSAMTLEQFKAMRAAKRR